MAGKADFKPDEWARVVASPMIVGMAVTAADPSGLWGLLKEAMASGWVLLEAKQDAAANPLVKAIADDITVTDTRTAVRNRMQTQFAGLPLGQIKAKAIDELRALAELVSGKVPNEAPGFKAWLNLVAQKTAEAGNEGGFLGFGGVPVSNAERATLTEIAAALNPSTPRL